MTKYIYIVVRSDLSKEQQLVQACHAAIKATFQFDSDPRSSLVVLKVDNKAGLNEVANQLIKTNIKHEMFYESWGSIGNTALATNPISKQEEGILNTLDLLKY